MPPKRKGVAEHAKVPIGRNKIRRGAGGKKLVEDTIRNNVLLYLEKLTNEEATNTAGDSFGAKLSSAVTGALDPVAGPEAVVDLSSYSFDDLTIFGNKEAGELMAVLLGLLDDGGGKRIGEMKEKKKAVEQALASLQSLIPITTAGQKDLSKQLQALIGDTSDDGNDTDVSMGDAGDEDASDEDGHGDEDGDGDEDEDDDSDAQDAGWLYGILWTSCLQWMDARLRQMRAFANATNNKRLLPDSFQTRGQMINTRVHGGDLRVDAIISQINYGNIRHADGNYDVFFQDGFKRMYNLSIDDGLWLAKHGHQWSRSVDWPRIIGVIDKFVAMSDRVTGPRWPKLPANFNSVHANRFKPFCAHVTSLIQKAKADKNWESDQTDRNTLGTLYTNLLKDCSTWKDKGNKIDEWTRMADLHSQWPWPPANYLRDAATAAPRSVGQGGAVMRLRPLVRIKYPK